VYRRFKLGADLTVQLGDAVIKRQADEAREERVLDGARPLRVLAFCRAVVHFRFGDRAQDNIRFVHVRNFSRNLGARPLIYRMQVLVSSR